jgi:hypothetical protein
MLIGPVLTVSACSGSCQGTQPAPSAWALGIEVQFETVRVLWATPSRGVAAPPSIDRHLAGLRRRDVLWIEYALKSASDAALPGGAFAVAMTAIVDRDEDEKGGGRVRVPKRVVTVRVPYSPEARTIAFNRLEPSAGPPDTWQRVSMGASTLAPAKSK